MAKLILVRHGQSQWNAANRFTGWVDVPLTAKGIKEALNCGEKLRGTAIDVVFISTLIRSQLTAFLALANHDSGKTPILSHEETTQLGHWGKIHAEQAIENSIPVYRAWQLNERWYGDLQGLNKTETKAKFGADQVHIWRRSFEIPPPNGESLKMTSERTLPYFHEVVKPHLAKGRNVLISAHGNSLRSIVMELEGLSGEAVTQLEIPTGEPRTYLFKDSQFSSSRLT